MLDGVFNLLETIGKAIVDAFEILVKWYNDALYINTLMHSAALSIPSYFQWLPDLAISMFVSLLAIVIVYKIFGRT